MWSFKGRPSYSLFSALFRAYTVPPKAFCHSQFADLCYDVGQRWLGTYGHRGYRTYSVSDTLISSISIIGRFSTSSRGEESDCDNASDDDGNEFDLGRKCNKDENLIQNAEAVMDIMCDFGRDAAETKRKLDECEMPASPELVEEVLSRLRNDWAAAFTLFLWAQRQPGYAHSTREYHTMISILGKMRKFDTAWSLVDEMRRAPGISLLCPQTLLILIRKYCAVHDVAKAIGTFYSFKRYGFTIGLEQFQDLLSALCRYKNVQDAEHLLICNENAFPFDTKSFNIVLNGWCNMVVNLREAKRFWKDMGRRGIHRDVVSYGSMISCYSKAGSLRDVLKLFDQMKHLGIAPDRKVYNAVVYAFAKGKCVKEAINLVKTMGENGFPPNTVTYNSLIKPLCKARRTEDARILLHEMLQRGLSPSVRTYHAFLAIVRTAEEAFEWLDKMKETGCPPAHDTYIMLTRKFCRWRQLENVSKLWDEMQMLGVSPDRSSYIVLIHGLFLNGKLDDAFKCYQEMKEKGFDPEPKTDEMLQSWLYAKETSRAQMAESSTKRDLSLSKNNSDNFHSNKRDFLKQPERRSVMRERGFSLW